jgi:hypothetical protein
LSTAIEIIKWDKKIAVAQAKVTHILRPGKASEKTPKGVIRPSLCEISQNAAKKNKKIRWRPPGIYMYVVRFLEVWTAQYLEKDICGASLMHLMDE